MASHSVIHSGDKVVIRNLELFCGFDPEIDKPGSSAEKYDRAKVQSIVDKTKAHMARGQLPQLVERHKRDGDTVDPTCFGCIPSISFEDRNGVPYILGDVEVSKAVFDSHIATNKYSRRSAEIWADGHMSEVALLGRETPARPIADTRFTKQGDRDIFEMPEGGTFPGQGNTEIPTLVDCPPKGKKKEPMDDTNTELKDQFAKQAQELTALKESFAKQLADEREAFTKAIAETNARAFAAEAEAKKEHFSRVIDQMDSEGFRVNLVRDQLLDKICNAKDAQAEIDFFRKVITRDPIGQRVDVKDTVTGEKSVWSKDELDAQMAVIVKETAGNPAEFAKRVAKFTAKK